ncbi:MAG: helix-turn-helix transcriptional regulator [Acidobacteriota bacterium]|jgi:transcriptional regulator with XRE-family HTH domain
MPVFEGLGKALRWLREKQTKRQYQVAEDAGITKAMLSAYETGKQRPSLETIEKVLGALDVDLVTLQDALDHVNERPRPPAPNPVPATPEAGRVDVHGVLGVRSLPREEEEALRQMLEGFHRFLRYLHRTRFGGEEG